MSDFDILKGMSTNTTTQSNLPTMSLRELVQKPSGLSKLVRIGREFIVTRHGQPFFLATPIKEKKGKTIHDFDYLMFSDPKMDKNLSKKVDEIVYGI